MAGCLRNLEIALLFTGTRPLVMHTRSYLLYELFNGQIRVNASVLKERLKEHIPGCSSCLSRYSRFLDRQKTGKWSRKEVDKNYLNVLG